MRHLVTYGLQLFAALIAGHMLGDFPLQGDFLAKAKNHRAPIAGVPWQIALLAHAIIQGAIVGLLSGCFIAALAETNLHAMIDFAKNDGGLGDGGKSFALDQLLHILCKLVWVAAIVAAAVRI